MVLLLARLLRQQRGIPAVLFIVKCDKTITTIIFRTDNEKTPTNNSATTISPIDFVEKWGLTPVLRPRQEQPRSVGESESGGQPPLLNDR